MSSVSTRALVEFEVYGIAEKRATLTEFILCTSAEADSQVRFAGFDFIRFDIHYSGLQPTQYDSSTYNVNAESGERGGGIMVRG